MKVLRLDQFFPETSGFRRNFFTLVSGTSIAQALGLLFLPVLTRLYEPEAFGLFGIFYAIICVLGILSTWRMEMTVVLPQEESEARKLWKGSFYLLGVTSSFFSAVLLIVMILWPWESRPWPETWATLSLGLFLIGFSEALMQWHNRRQNFKVLAAKNVIERLSVIGFSIGYSLLGLQMSGLIWAQISALIVCVVYMLWTTFPASPIQETVTVTELRRLLSSYRDFPLMQGWSMLFLIGATQLPNLLFGWSFTMEDTGHVNLAYRILEAPVNLFAVSFATAFYQHISQKAPQEIGDLFARSTRSIFKWIFPVFLAGAIAAPYLFPVIFGEDWTSAGAMAPSLALMTFFKILYLSHNVIFLVLRRLDLDLKISGSIVLAQLVGFYVTNHWSDSPVYIVTAMSLLSTLAFAVGLFLIHRQIKTSARIATL